TMPRAEALVAVSKAVNYLGNGLFLIAVTAVIYGAGRFLKKEKLKNAGREGFFSVALAGIAVNILKAAFERPRMNYHGFSIMTLLENPSFFDPMKRLDSFPSGHTSVSFAFASALSSIYPQLGFLLYPLAFLVALARVYLTSHYPTDTVAGVMVGLGAAYVLARRSKERETPVKGALFFLIVFISFLKLGSFLLFDLDEAVFSVAAREMLYRGSLLTPTYNMLARFDKPILFYWLLISSFTLFGATEFAARFFPAAFGVMLSVMTFSFVKRMKGFRCAAWSTVVIVLNIAYLTYTHAAITDMPLTFFISASLYSFYAGYTAAGEDKRRWFFYFWLSSAFAVLVKGAVGVIFPLSIACIYLFLSNDMKRLRELFKASYVLIFLLITLPWFLIQFRLNGWEFFNAFIIRHHMERYTGVISGHRGPVYYYIGVLVLGFFPWVALLPGALWRGIKEKITGSAGLHTFTAVWFLFILVFFTVARTKLPNYILPLLPAASILAGVTLAEFAGLNGPRRWLYILFALSFLLASASYVIPLTVLKTDALIPEALLFTLGFIFLVISGLSILAILNPGPGLAGITAATLLLLIFVRVELVAPVNLYLQKTLYTYSTYIKGLNDETLVLATYRINNPSINFYSEKDTVNLWKRDDALLKDLTLRTNLVLVTKTSFTEEIKKIYAFRVLRREDDYVLLTNMPGLSWRTP
ncbi:MAG: phosphatase PAP2 family protein, partial [Deltaproteobacteria bacterium]|nr:phosphatase PAP2 family protein [Deltaproteobacteria bacterium]